MHTHSTHPFQWATASFGAEANGQPAEADGLAAHVQRCNGARGRWFSLQCLADLTHGFIAPRFVTTVGIAAIGVALISLLA